MTLLKRLARPPHSDYEAQEGYEWRVVEDDRWEVLAAPDTVRRCRWGRSACRRPSVARFNRGRIRSYGRSDGAGMDLSRVDSWWHYCAEHMYAWRPTANLPGSLAYTERKESHERLCERLAAVRSLSANASPELRFLLDAMRRVAGCSFSNRRGEPYYWRRQQVWELRGCLDVWDRSRAAA